MAGRDDEPVDEGAGLIGTEPHPDLTSQTESSKRDTLLLQLQKDVTAGRHLSVHLVLEYVEYLLTALSPIAQVPDLLSADEAQGVLKRVGGYPALIIIHHLRPSGNVRHTGQN